MFDFIRGLLSGVNAKNVGVLVDKFNSKLKPILQTKELGHALYRIRVEAARGRTVLGYVLCYDSDVDVLVQQLKDRGFSCDEPHTSCFGSTFVNISW